MLGPVVLLATAFALYPAAGQSGEYPEIFKPALEEIRDQTRVPIMLPLKFPEVLRDPRIESTTARASESEYSIALYYGNELIQSNATYAAAFSGSTRILTIADIVNSRGIYLSNGRVGIFRPVSCGGSCAPANLWWERDGVMYHVAIKLSSTMDEREQERILVETANACVVVH